ncbi:MAG: circadian clock KaiB family protein [Nitrospiria bacterium]
MDHRYQLDLYLSGIGSEEKKQIEVFDGLLHGMFKSQYFLKVIDVQEKPELAQSENILATPAFVRVTPGPKKKFLVDLSSKEKMATRLELLR